LPPWPERHPQTCEAARGHLLDADPLVDVANVERRAGVMVAGRWLPESEIQARLAEIAAAR